MNDKNIRNQFNDQGYVISKNLISNDKINKLLESFETFTNSGEIKKSQKSRMLFESNRSI